MNATALRAKYKNLGFRVLGIRVEKNEIADIHIRLRDTRNIETNCPDCGKPVTYFAYSRIRTYRDEDIETGQRVFLHVFRKEMHCGECKKHFTAEHEFLNSRYITNDLRKKIKFFTTNPELSGADIAAEFGVSPSTVRAIKLEK